jgi:MoxR-like ATPase
MAPDSTTLRRNRPSQISESDVKAAGQLAEAHQQLVDEMKRVIIGQTDVIDQMLIALFCQGHCVLEGVPGLAKTLMISTLAQLLSLSFRRIQFTPDLMPSDITGMEILEEDEGTGHRRMKFVKGPIFANVLLGDEINRTPPKTQAALLQAMQEYKVTVAGADYQLDRPFFVLGTQNPIEQEGTYPLPEAQLDRFMFKILVDYPSYEDELAIAEATTSQDRPELQPVLSRETILKLQQIVRKVLVGRSVASYAVKLARATRPHSPDAPDFIKKYLTWGAGPRACQAMLLGAKARALLQARYHVSADDIRYVAAPVLRHRLVTSFTAEADGVTPDHIVEKLCEVIEEPAEA